MTPPTPQPAPNAATAASPAPVRLPAPVASAAAPVSPAVAASPAAPAAPPAAPAAPPAAVRLPAPAVAETLTGVLERIIYFNEENHYTVGELRPEPPRRGAPQPQPITITGALPGVHCGETLEIEGVWTHHREHGARFKIQRYKSRLPSTVHGIRKYLASGLVPGIGKTYASKIVDKFGEKTLEIISTQSARLREVPGIGAKRVREIKQAWDEQSSLRDVMVFLHTYGVTTALCLRIIRQYGAFAKMLLESEPYKIAREIEGIGFRTADRIARNLGLPTEGAARLEAGILHVLGELEEEGHTAALRAPLIARAAAALEVPPDKIAASLDALVEKRQLVPAGDSLQTPVHARAEEQTAAAVRQILAAPSALPPVQIERAITWAQDRAGFAFAPAQAAAIRATLAGKFTILTGGPGTGKTTILAALTSILAAKKARILLAAPTGRAAQRMAETTRHPASTIHRLLKFEAATRRFAHDTHNPLAADLVVVDEASMLDNRLAAALLRAIPPRAHVLLVGDTHQLPSVGPGNVLADLAASRLIPVTTLTAIHRQGARSQIVTTAHDILHGNPAPPPLRATYDPAVEIQFIPAPTPEATLATLTQLCRDLLPAAHQLDPFRDIQTLAPMHKGLTGTQTINQTLQAALRPLRHARAPAAAPAAGQGRTDILVCPPSATGQAGMPALPSPLGHPASAPKFAQQPAPPPFTPPDTAAAVPRLEPGDKIIQTRNNYDKAVFNGDLGRVRAIHPDSGLLTADFDTTTADYERADQDELQLAYAITIHKSQGSEFDTVLIPLLKAHFVMLQRNLVYTAITRGRKRVILLGDPSAYTLAIKNSESLHRHTLLPHRLAESPAADGTAGSVS